MSRNKSRRSNLPLIHYSSRREQSARRNATGSNARIALIAILSVAAVQPAGAGSGVPNTQPPAPAAHVTNTGPLLTLARGDARSNTTLQLLALSISSSSRRRPNSLRMSVAPPQRSRRKRQLKSLPQRQPRQKQLSRQLLRQRQSGWPFRPVRSVAPRAQRQALGPPQRPPVQTPGQRRQRMLLLPRR